MPDSTLLLEALVTAAASAAAVFLLCCWPWPAPGRARVASGWVLGVGAGLYLGCWGLGLWPRRPPGEEQDYLVLLLQGDLPNPLGQLSREGPDRFLNLLVPAALVVELMGAFLRRPGWLVWLLRAVVAAGAARVLLHNTTYLADLAGPDTREWTPLQAGLILGGLGAALLTAWVLLVWLARRAPGRSPPLALALASAGAAVTIMYSGSVTVGQLGLPLAAALTGATVASLARPDSPGGRGAVGVGVVGLFALVVLGHFFGKLTAAHGVLLFLAPLACWLPELPGVRRVGPWFRGLGRAALVAGVVALVVTQAREQFVEDSATTAPTDAKEPTLEDYMNYGK